MRVLVLALAVAFVAANQDNHVPKFTQGQTYIYKYEGEIMGGLPEQGLARAGVKIQSRVLIRATADSKLLLKLENVQLFEYSGIWPKDSFTPATKLTTALAAQLLAPVKFEYKSGVVGKVYAPTGVSENVLNTYKGILNILQMNVKKTQNVYDLQELGSQGVCKTQYTIREDQKAERIYISKTKDLNECQESILKDFGLSYMDKCIACRDKGNALKGAASFKYTLKPEINGSRILQATVTELIQFSPAYIVNGAPQMHSKQNLTFIEQKDIQVVPSSEQYIPRGSLQYEFGSELLLTPIHILKGHELSLRDLFNDLVTSNQGKVQQDAPLKFIQLIQLLREAPYEKIEELWRQYKDKQEYRPWILNAIPATRIHASLRFIKEKYVSGELTLPEVIQSLMVSIRGIKVDEEAIGLVKEMVMLSEFQKDPLLHHAVRLGYGSLVDKYCVENQACSPELMKIFHDYLSQAVERRETEEIISHLKVLGNAGHPASRKAIQKLLPGFGSAAASLPHRVHVEAVLALRNMARREPKMVQEMAIQLFINRELNQELRMVAAMVLFETKLPMGLVMTIADTVLKEKNLQISSFVYSYMKSMTKSVAPDRASVAAACNIAIKILSPRLNRMSYRYSRFLYTDVYDYSWMVGAAVSAHYINEAATILPKSFVAKASTYVAGIHADVIEVGARTEGMQDAIRKISAQEDDRESERINKMRTIIRALNAWRAEPSNKPLASMYVKIFGQEIAFGTIDKELVTKYIELVKQYAAQTSGLSILETLKSGFSMYYTKAMMLAEVRRILPTTVGFPMEVSFYTAAVVAASTELQVAVSPQPTENFQAADLLKSDIRMRAAIVPSIAADTYAVMGVNTALITAALMSRAKVHAIVPAKIEAIVDMVRGNFKLQLLPVQGINKIVSAEHETFAVVRSVEEARITPLIPAEGSGPMSSQKHSSQSSRMASSLYSNDSASSEILRPNQYDSRRIQLPKYLLKKRCSEWETFGFKLCSETRIRNASYIGESPLYAILGTHVAEITVTPVGPAVETIEVEVQVGERSAEKIIKQINVSEEDEITESKNVLLKLKKILSPTQRSSNSSSSSSSSSQSGSSHSSSSSSFSSSSSSQSSHSSASGRRLSKPVSSSSQSSKSSSSSSSSQENSASKQKLPHLKFVKQHIHQHALSAGHGNSASSAYSFENIYNKAKYLAKSIAPSVTILIRGVRADKKVQGYQVAAYVDKATSRLQVIMANLAEDNHYRICADGMILSYHKLMTKIGWGLECRQYKAEIVAESGLIDQKPAARLKLSWDKLPRRMQYNIKRLSRYISHVAKKAGLNIAKIKHIENQIKLTVSAVSETSFNVVLQTSKRAIYKLGASFPIPVPIEKLSDQGEWHDRISHMLVKTTAAECQIVGDRLTTFNNKKFDSLMPHQCEQVLAQDCTEDMKFIVLLKKDQMYHQNEVTVLFGDVGIQFYMKDNVSTLAVHGVNVDMNDSVFEPKKGIKIQRSGRSLYLTAPASGLLKLIYEGQLVKVVVAESMRGRTCGLCGTANGETKLGYRSAYNRQLEDPNSFAHSWVLGGESCRDSSGCLMRLESVKLERQVNVYGQDSKCYSVDPVLRCLPGCMPVRTTPVKVGYHCVPIDSYMNAQAVQSNIHEKSVDFTEPAEAHVACRCNAQCA